MTKVYCPELVLHDSMWAGQVISVTGDLPYLANSLRLLVRMGGGIIGDTDIWQKNQVIVVGDQIKMGQEEEPIDRAYLQRSMEIGRQFRFMCQYMSQEDFIKEYINGHRVDYFPSDPRILRHPGLGYVASLKGGWPHSSAIPIRKLNWQILPPGRYYIDQILSHYRNLRLEGERIEVDESRLVNIYNLLPTEVYIGTDEFRRYIVFYFSSQRKAVLECPIYGNAIYVIDGPWELLSQYTKDDLLRNFSDQVKKIEHKGNWLQRLIAVLQ